MAFEKFRYHISALFKRRESFSRNFWKLKCNPKANWEPGLKFLKLTKLIRGQLTNLNLYPVAVLNQAYSTILHSCNSNLVSPCPFKKSKLYSFILCISKVSVNVCAVILGAKHDCFLKDYFFIFLRPLPCSAWRQRLSTAWWPVKVWLISSGRSSFQPFLFKIRH